MKSDSNGCLEHPFEGLAGQGGQGEFFSPGFAWDDFYSWPFLAAYCFFFVGFLSKSKFTYTFGL